jgi:hypothetical protein
MKTHLFYLVDERAIPKDELMGARKGLPTRKIDCVIEFGALHFPTSSYYHVIAIIEKAFEQSSSTGNLLLYGNKLVTEIKEQLEENKNIQAYLNIILPDETKDDEAMDVLQHTARTQTRIRGKDFARGLMARSKKSLDIDLCPGLTAKVGAARKNALKNKVSEK